ncbi:MAG: tetratricopeptide repeat protein [Verrucomicrobiia bacterium]|jgi:tetratricopeptide (TPR) repeat protein
MADDKKHDRILQLEEEVKELRKQLNDQPSAHFKELTEATLANLKAANTALTDSYKTRWGSLGIMLPVITVILTAAVGYQLWKAETITTISDRSEKAVQTVADSARVLGHFANAMCILDNGFRELWKERYSISAKYADQTVEDLKSAREIIRHFPGNKPDEANFKTSLDETAKKLLFSAYSLKAHSCIEIYRLTKVGNSGGNRDKLRPVLDVVKAMMAIDEKKERWESHHFLGLYYSYNENFEEARKEYEESIKLDFDTKLDAINLAEDYFVNEHFDKALETALSQQKYDPDAATEIHLAAKFFERASLLLEKDDLKQEEIFLKHDIGPLRGYGKTYSFSELIDFEKDIGTNKLVKAKFTQPQKDAVRRMIKGFVDSSKGVGILPEKGNN